MTEVCWNSAAGPIAENVAVDENGRWAEDWDAVDRHGHDVLPDASFYANDETGEILAFGRRDQRAFLVNGEPLVMRARLGAGSFKLVRRRHIPLTDGNDT